MKAIRQLDMLPPLAERTALTLRYRRPGRISNGVRRLDMWVSTGTYPGPFSSTRLHWWVPTYYGHELAWCDTRREAASILCTYDFEQDTMNV